MIDFFEFCNEMLCVADHRGYFIQVNQAWTKHLGWSAAELTSRPFLDFVHPDDLDATRHEAQLLLNGGHETISFENRYRCRNGSYRWLAWVATAEPDSNLTIGTARDITDERRQAEALRESEQRFRTLADHAPVGIIQADAAGNVNYVNAKWCEIAGVASHQAFGLAWRECIHPDDLAEELQRWHKATTGGQDVPPHELRFLQKSGEVRWASSSIAVLRDAKGDVVGQITTVEDISERKNTDSELRDAERRFHAFMDNSPTTAWSKDEFGRIVYLNKTCEQQLNLTLEECYGKTDFDYWPREIAERLQRNDRQVLESWLPLQRFEQTASADRQLRNWMTILFPYRDRSNLRYVGGIAIDITELKQAELALQSKQDLLRNLIEVQENEKQRLCYEFHDGLVQYAAGALMSLEGYLSNHPSSDVTPTLQAAITNLRIGIDDGRRTIRGIRPPVFDGSDLAAAIYDLLRPLSDSDLSVTFACSSQLEGIPESVQTAIYRVVQEALHNARKHSGAEIIRIELQKANGELQLSVRDWGSGFDTQAKPASGFGLLGMAERVRLLGGEFNLDSKIGEGTTISVRLPLHTGENGELIGNHAAD